MSRIEREIVEEDYRGYTIKTYWDHGGSSGGVFIEAGWKAAAWRPNGFCDGSWVGLSREDALANLKQGIDRMFKDTAHCKSLPTNQENRRGI